MNVDEALVVLEAVDYDVDSMYCQHPGPVMKEAIDVAIACLKNQRTMDDLLTKAQDAVNSANAEMAEFQKKLENREFVYLGTPAEDDNPGIQAKYHIFRTKDNMPVTEMSFTLIPDKDVAACYALQEYARFILTTNPILAHELRSWTDEVLRRRAEGDAK